VRGAAPFSANFRRLINNATEPLCVRWYLRYKLSYRDLVEMMAERGLSVAHSTILRWVRRYTPEFDKRWGALVQTCSSARMTAFA